MAAGFAQKVAGETAGSQHTEKQASIPRLNQGGECLSPGAREDLIRKIFRFVTYFFQSSRKLALVQFN